MDRKAISGNGGGLLTRKEWIPRVDRDVGIEEVSEVNHDLYASRIRNEQPAAKLGRFKSFMNIDVCHESLS
jgi:hypothetical protein